MFSKEHYKGAVIFYARYRGGRKLPGVGKLNQQRSWGMKSTGPTRLGFENCHVIFYGL